MNVANRIAAAAQMKPREKFRFVIAVAISDMSLRTHAVVETDDAKQDNNLKQDNNVKQGNNA